MKKIIRLNVLAYLLVAGSMSIHLGCSSAADNKKTTNEGEAAYHDFKEYVTSTESTTDYQADSGQADWDKTAAAAQADYDKRVAQLDQYAVEYDEARQEEIADLKSRHEAYWQKREADFKARTTATSIAVNSVNGGVATDFQVSEVTTTSPANIRLAYENLVNRIQAKKDTYNNADWKIINNYYETLDDRKEAVEEQLSDKDKYEIAKAKTQYVALRTAARFDPDVSETAADVKETAVNTSQKVGNKAQQVGSDIKKTAKSGANKVENAAQKVGSEVKSTTKKVAKKIDSKIDANPNKD